MKKIFISAMLALVATTTAFAQNRAERLSLDDPGSFSMILLGDPQTYLKYKINQPIFDLMTCWIADNVDNLKIKAVLCTGDLVDQNHNLVTRNPVRQTSRQMWEAGSRAFSTLDNLVPYIISTGNHDYGYRKAENGNTHFPEYFPIERNPLWQKYCLEVFPNRSGIESLENAIFEFKDPVWGKILVICNEFAPRDEVLQWTGNFIAADKYKNHKVIYMTHSLLHERQGERTDNENYDISPANWGQQVWEKLLYPSSNIVLAICGHTGKPTDDFQDTVAYRVDKNANGGDVRQMMFNTQMIGGGWHGNGGDGWLRILEFKPDGKTISVKTYSPFFGISPSTKHLAHRTAPYDQFDITID